MIRSIRSAFDVVEMPSKCAGPVRPGPVRNAHTPAHFDGIHVQSIGLR